MKRAAHRAGQLEMALPAGEGLVCGVDEAGRGPLAGPVCAAAVVLDAARAIDGLADSKTLAASKREVLAATIRAEARAWALGWASVEEVDALNILQATLLAMRRAVLALGQPVAMALVDGNRAPQLPCLVRPVIGGDALEPAISAASILAKTARDAHMRELHRQFPHWAFDRHAGYPTPLHLSRLREHGPSPVHRRTFAPVRTLLEARGEA